MNPSHISCTNASQHLRSACISMLIYTDLLSCWHLHLSQQDHRLCLSLARSFFLFFFLVQLNKFVVTQIFPETVSAPSSLFSLICEVFLMFLDTCSVGGMLSIKGTQISVQCFCCLCCCGYPVNFPRYGTSAGLSSYLILKHRLTFILFIRSNPQ